MVTEKRMIDANALMAYIHNHDYELVSRMGCVDKGMFTDGIEHGINIQTTVDAVEVDTVIEMFEYMLGDCPCNFSPADEWLAERCELQNECPNPKDKRGCWKQFIKHFIAKMDGDGND